MNAYANTTQSLPFKIGELTGEHFGLDLVERERNFLLRLHRVSHGQFAHPVARFSANKTSERKE